MLSTSSECGATMANCRRTAERLYRASDRDRPKWCNWQHVLESLYGST